MNTPPGKLLRFGGGSDGRVRIITVEGSLEKKGKIKIFYPFLIGFNSYFPIRTSRIVSSGVLSNG